MDIGLCFTWRPSSDSYSGETEYLLPDEPPP